MLKFLTPAAASAALVIGAALPAAAADLYYEPEIVEMPSAPEVVYKDKSFGGWYIRGDLGYRTSTIKGIDYITYGGVAVGGQSSFDFGRLRNTLSVGAGVGYQINHYLRADVTGDFWSKAGFRGQTTGTGVGCPGGVCVSTDTSSFSALLLLANAYADLGTYKRITPYIGAGIGGAYVKWDDLRNVYDTNFGTVDVSHRGAKGMRFAWALMAGASYCINNNLHADLGYRFTNISGGRMFQYAQGGGPGFHRDIRTHEVRAGLRYQFGGANYGCEGKQPKQVVYKEHQPLDIPIYK